MKPVVVLKVGGSLKDTAIESLITAVQTAVAAGKSPVIVHGGGPRITEALAEIGAQLPFVGGQRLTPAAVMPIVERVLCEEVNAEIAVGLGAVGIPTRRLLRAENGLYAAPLPDMGRTSVVTSVDTTGVSAALAAGNVPVIAPVATEQATGLSCNVNADLSASAIARALTAERVVFFTDVEGIYSDYSTRQRIDYATDTVLSQGLVAGRFEGGMRPKVTAVLEALQAGAEAAFVIHGGNQDAAAWAVAANIGAGMSTVRTAALGTCVLRTSIHD
ncbi:acetylglutamate kinase [Alicyclobacillus ferrooxydans]|uniref:acetylglutamate kinase n=1 Tax=Alicyclobacillus ferrooxydans TaxID=471514 RepID=UPI0006D52B99|nr:acetylglutamate kinase [Alicyclobacillus ferrooxydans]